MENQREHSQVLPKLVSFKLCPFVQRVVIALLYKNVEHRLEYIDLAHPPEWFLDLSPLKKVPLLLVEGHVLFASAVINEYLDEAYENKLHPRDMFLRAKNRAWIEHGNTCMGSAFYLSVEETEKDFVKVLEDLWAKFDPLENGIEEVPFFNGTQLSLVDASYAPLFQRLQYLDEIRPGIFDEKRHPKISAWKDHLLKLDAVQDSCVPEIKTLYSELLWKRQGYVSRFLDKSAHRQNVSKSVY